MKVALDLFLTLLVLVAGFWIALFGSTGVVLASRSRFTKMQGFFVGSLLGPFGLIWLLIRGRHTPPETSSLTDRFTGEAEAPEPNDGPSSGSVDLNI